eukprot:4626440-Prymnesium_polylepis.2
MGCENAVGHLQEGAIRRWAAFSDASCWGALPQTSTPRASVGDALAAPALASQRPQIFSGTWHRWKLASARPGCRSRHRRSGSNPC